MRSIVHKCRALSIAVIFVALGNVNGAALAADPAVDLEALQQQLDEAKELLEQDKTSHAETAEKKRIIDEKLAAQKARETKIFDELKQLCEEQDKLEPGSLDSCMAKLNN